jgi:hypothetical protein
LALLGDADGDLRVRLLARLAAGPLRDTLPPEPREAMSEDALQMARRLGDRAALAYALEGRHCANMGPQTVDRRRAIADELIAVAEQIETPNGPTPDTRIASTRCWKPGTPPPLVRRSRS